MTRAGTAAVWSFILPGLGQLYNGDIARALFWLVIAACFYTTAFIFTGPLTLFGVLGHIIPAYTAYNRARQRFGDR
ncbi:MAG: hypothetical protein JNK72_18205 [Myxococcales bacterium]|nr:hypothetical protein [Myxococcales bacterium]